ncbi:hypothetical protein REPUB_Repub02eG0002800 [Reevesia pubescens]
MLNRSIMKGEREWPKKKKKRRKRWALPFDVDIRLPDTHSVFILYTRARQRELRVVSETGRICLLLPPPPPALKEVDVMGVQEYAAHPNLKPSVVVTGSAKECNCGPTIGLIDIGVSQSAFLFRVALPGIRNDQSKVKCEIQRDGKVLIQGMVTEGAGLLQGLSSICQMRVQKLCSPGPFTISFSLPGPVDPRLYSPRFRPDGILEVVIMRYRRPSDPS